MTLWDDENPMQILRFVRQLTDSAQNDMPSRAIA
jgi:hypothetical protein